MSTNNKTESPTQTISTHSSSLLSTILFIAATAFIYFWQLGHRGLWQSEDRWAEIARNMVLTGDYFHPIMNSTIYFDKPLISYWFIAWVGEIFGHMNEWVVRIPSALMGIVGLIATFQLTRKHWSDRTAWLAVWVLLTSFGVIFWSRTAAADMANAAMSVAAIAWFYNNKEKPSFINYFVFYFICIVGAQTKGLGALAVPILAVVPYLFRNQHWKLHLNLAHVGAGLICAGLYFLPFYYASVTPLASGYHYQEHGMTGLELVYKENVQRFFKPFDHTGGVSTYFTGLPYIMLPWAPVLVAALFTRLKNFKALSTDSRWLLEAILLIFCFFTLSGSRRWYYILPLAPLCAIMIADYLQEEKVNKLKLVAVALIELMWAVATILFIASPLLWPYAEKHFPVPEDLKTITLSIGLVSAVVWLIKFTKPQLLASITNSNPLSAGVIVLTLVMWGGWFGFQNESLDALRTERRFALTLKEQLKPTDTLIFYKDAVPKIVFYLNSPTPYRVIEKPEELAQAVQSGPILLMAQQRRTKEISQALQLSTLPAPVLEESISSWEQKHRKLDKKLVVWQLEKTP